QGLCEALSSPPDPTSPAQDPDWYDTGSHSYGLSLSIFLDLEIRFGFSAVSEWVKRVAETPGVITNARLCVAAKEVFGEEIAPRLAAVEKAWAEKILEECVNRLK
ncbi:MAG: hypothetical protein HYY16_01670, partial [Planctomycetes bacterium]|nr:hypothetical protein [Planctomycetota bacterium]